MIWPKKMIKFLLCLLFILLYGCSFFTDKVESLAKPIAESSPPVQHPARQPKKNLFCFQESGSQILLEDEYTSKYYQQFLKNIFENNTFSFIQKAAALALIEMSRRPDEASPSARLQYFIRYKNNTFYFDFSSSSATTSMPYVKGLELLLKNFDNSKKLYQVAEKLDELLPANLNVSREFENFLLQNRASLIKNEILTETFFKGDEVLTKHETFKRVKLKKLFSYYNANFSNDALYSIKTNLESETISINKTVKCNLNIADDFISKDQFDQNKSHYFAIKEGNNFFIAVSSAQLEKASLVYKDTYFFKANPASALPVCYSKNEIQDIVLFSTTGRYPGQHLKHLFNYDLELADTFSSLGELLNFSRHLFLDNPDRILYESKKGRKSQLDLFLLMNFPIYHVETLGDIVGAAAFKTGPKETRSLFVDERTNAKILCDR